jgi:hypothetical protein
MLENATRICEARFGNLYLHADGALCIAAARRGIVGSGGAAAFAIVGQAYRHGGLPFFNF